MFHDQYHMMVFYYSQIACDGWFGTGWDMIVAEGEEFEQSVFAMIYKHAFILYRKPVP